MENKDKDFEELEEQLAFAEDKVCSLEQMIKDLTAKHEKQMLQAKEELQSYHSAIGSRYNTGTITLNTGNFVAPDYGGTITVTNAVDYEQPRMPRLEMPQGELTTRYYTDPLTDGMHYPTPVQNPFALNPWGEDGVPAAPPTPMVNRLEELERRIIEQQNRLMYADPIAGAPDLIGLEQAVTDNQAAFENEPDFDGPEVPEGEND